MYTVYITSGFGTRHPKVTFLILRIKVIVSQDFKSYSQVFGVFFMGCRVDKNIVDETTTNQSKCDRKTWFIKSIKAARAFVKPEGMTRNLVSYRVRNAVFKMLASRILN